MKGISKILRPRGRHHASGRSGATMGQKPTLIGAAPPASNPTASSPQDQPSAGADSPPSKPGNQAGAAGDSTINGSRSISAGDDAALLTLGEAGEILSAREACGAVFGWESPELAGQNIRVLLKGGLDNEVGRFLLRHREGKVPEEMDSLRVIALRKGGAEFSAAVTTLTWQWETTGTQGADVSRLRWTAAFKKSAAGAEPPTPASLAQSLDSLVARLAAEGPALAEAKRPAGEREDLAAVQHEQLDAAKVQSGKAGTEPIERKNPFEQELAALQQVRDQLQGQLTSEQRTAAEHAHRIEELESELRRAAGASKGSKAGAGPRDAREIELRSELAAAKAAADYAEATLKEQVARNEKLEERLQNLSNSLRLEQAERSKRFEEELFGLRRERDDLNRKLADEQQAAGESTKQAEELEARLARNAAEFERAKAELEKQGAERERSESEWREQLDTAWVMKKEVEGAWAGAVERNKRFEEELADLRRERDEINRKLAAEQQAAVESQQRAKEVESRLGRNATESDRAKAELEKQNAERDRSDAEWRQQLDAAKALKARLEISLAEAAEQNKRLEKELADFRQERDELKRRLEVEQESAADSRRRAEDLTSRLEHNTTELQRAKTEIETQGAARERAEAKWREQQESAAALARKLEADWAGAVERNVRFEEEVTRLRQARDELTARLKSRQETGAGPGQRTEDLERRFQENTAELERAQAALQKQSAERERSESDWREQLEGAKALSAKLESAWTGAVERNRRFEAELAGLRREREDLIGQLAAEQKAASESYGRVEELENFLNRNAAELQDVKAELEQQSAQREVPDSAWRDQLETAQAERSGLEQQLAGVVERNRCLESELADLRRDHGKLNGDRAAEEQGPAKTRQKARGAANRPDRSATELERVRAELEKAARQHSEHVQQYDFKHPNGQSARKTGPSTKRRARP